MKQQNRVRREAAQRRSLTRHFQSRGAASWYAAHGQGD